jgi:hypothetical protein
MMRLRMLGLALVAVFAVGVIAASAASAAKTGPHWWVNGAEQASTGQKHAMELVGGATMLTTKGLTFTCKKDKGTGEIIGGSPGTAKATVEFEGCEAEGCGGVSNEGDEVATTILVHVNAELVFLTKAAGEAEKPRLGILFKTIAAKENTFVRLTFGCPAFNGPITATGIEHGPGIPGVAGIVCEMAESAEAEEVTHEVEWAKNEQAKFWYYEGGVLKEGKAGLEFNGGVFEQAGKAVVRLVSGESFSARGV